MLTARGTADAIDATCGAETVRFERRVAASTPRNKDAPVYEWHPTGDAAVVIVRHLDGSPAERARLEQIAADYDAHRAKKTVVFDFRGNGGGNDGYVYAWAAKAVRGTWPAPYAEVKVTGAELPCGEWNNLVLRQIDADAVDTPTAKSERDTAMQSALASLKGATVQSVDMAPITNTAAHPYGGRVFAIVDRTPRRPARAGRRSCAPRWARRSSASAPRGSWNSATSGPGSCPARGSAGGWRRSGTTTSSRMRLSGCRWTCTWRRSYWASRRTSW